MNSKSFLLGIGFCLQLLAGCSPVAKSGEGTKNLTKNGYYFFQVYDNPSQLLSEPNKGKVVFCQILEVSPTHLKIKEFYEHKILVGMGELLDDAKQTKPPRVYSVERLLVASRFYTWNSPFEHPLNLLLFWHWFEKSPYPPRPGPFDLW